jgi:hypothetical protein
MSSKVMPMFTGNSLVDWEVICANCGQRAGAHYGLCQQMDGSDWDCPSKVQCTLGHKHFAFPGAAAEVQPNLWKGAYDKSGSINKPVIDKAINDHQCPTCKNDRVSKSEKAKKIPCWKCGGEL